MTRIFVCNACGESRPCVLHVPEDSDAPTGCPYPGGEIEVTWREAKVPQKRTGRRPA